MKSSGPQCNTSSGSIRRRFTTRPGRCRARRAPRGNVSGDRGAVDERVRRSRPGGGSAAAAGDRRATDSGAVGAADRGAAEHKPPSEKLQRTDGGLRTERETPVEQAGGLIPVRRAARFHQPVHHGDHQPAALNTWACGGAHERLARGISEARLAAQGAGLAAQQLVLVEDRFVAVIGGEHRRRLRGDLREHGVAHRGPEDDGQVVRRRVAGAAWSIQPGRRGGVGVRRPQRRGLGVHLGHGGAWAAQHLRQGVGGVVTRNQQQAVEQLARGVAAERFDADAVALHFGVGDIGDDGGVQVQLIEGHQRQQHLDGAGGGDGPHPGPERPESDRCRGRPRSRSAPVRPGSAAIRPVARRRRPGQEERRRWR